ALKVGLTKIASVEYGARQVSLLEGRLGKLTGGKAHRTELCPKEQRERRDTVGEYRIADTPLDSSKAQHPARQHLDARQERSVPVRLGEIAGRELTIGNVDTRELSLVQPDALEPDPVESHVARRLACQHGLGQVEISVSRIIFEHAFEKGDEPVARDRTLRRLDSPNPFPARARYGASLLCLAPLL
ncbi:MAG: hypothetical protein JWO42_2563, partial [Chloroflexi bacterium]|nr:hypothetical protein [Chloroflexota bacterium]